MCSCKSAGEGGSLVDAPPRPDFRGTASSSAHSRALSRIASFLRFFLKTASVGDVGRAEFRLARAFLRTSSPILSLPDPDTHSAFDKMASCRTFLRNWTSVGDTTVSPRPERSLAGPTSLGTDLSIWAAALDSATLVGAGALNLLALGLAPRAAFFFSPSNASRPPAPLEFRALLDSAPRALLGFDLLPSTPSAPLAAPLPALAGTTFSARLAAGMSSTKTSSMFSLASPVLASSRSSVS